MTRSIEISIVTVNDTARGRTRTRGHFGEPALVVGTQGVAKRNSSRRGRLGPGNLGKGIPRQEVDKIRTVVRLARYIRAADDFPVDISTTDKESIDLIVSRSSFIQRGYRNVIVGIGKESDKTRSAETGVLAALVQKLNGLGVERRD